MTTSIASVICIMIAIALIAYLSTNKVFSNKAEQKNSKGYYIIRVGMVNKLNINYIFVGSIFVFWFAIGESSTPNEALVILLLGIFFIILGLFLMIFMVSERIEYNDNEISQYRVFRKHPKTISWNDVINMKLQPVGFFLELYSSSKKIYVNLNCKGATELLRFIRGKLGDDLIDKL